MITQSLRDLLGPLPRLDGAACVGRPELFDVIAHEPDGDRELRTRLALAVCSTCPVIEACRAAIPPGAGHGVLVQGGVAVYELDQAERAERAAAVREQRRRRKEREREKWAAGEAARAEARRQMESVTPVGPEAAEAAAVRDEARKMLGEWGS